MPAKGQTKYNGLFEKGHKFGDWELLDPAPTRREKQKEYRYKCRCKCGSEKEVNCYNLEKGISTRCYECSVEDKFGEGNPFWSGHGLVSGKRFYRAKIGAEKRDIAFEIDIQIMNEELERSNFICALTGLKLNEETWSLDRIDSNKGYTRENIQYVHKDINRMKNSYEEDYYIRMCRLVAKHGAHAAGGCEIT